MIKKEFSERLIIIDEVQNIRNVKKMKKSSNNFLELVKYADNSFHALKVTFGNEIGILARSFNVDGRDVMDLFCLDTKLNLSEKYLKPGLPYGGSCLPKDLRALNFWGEKNNLSIPMLSNIKESNESQIENIINRITSESKGARIGLFGLTFKDNTDDLRESPMESKRS